jgi:hypothetical protein
MKHLHDLQLGTSTIAELRSRFDIKTIRGAAYALIETAFLPIKSLDLEEFRQFLLEIYKFYDPILEQKGQGLATNFRRAVKIYDYLKYGQKKTPSVPKDSEAE